MPDPPNLEVIDITTKNENDLMRDASSVKEFTPEVPQDDVSFAEEEESFQEAFSESEIREAISFNEDEASHHSSVRLHMHQTEAPKKIEHVSDQPSDSFQGPESATDDDLMKLDVIEDVHMAKEFSVEPVIQDIVIKPVVEEILEKPEI